MRKSLLNHPKIPASSKAKAIVNVEEIENWETIDFDMEGPDVEVVTTFTYEETLLPGICFKVKATDEHFTIPLYITN